MKHKRAKTVEQQQLSAPITKKYDVETAKEPVFCSNGSSMPWAGENTTDNGTLKTSASIACTMEATQHKCQNLGPRGHINFL